MLNQMIADFNHLKEMFDRNDIISYQLLLIKINQCLLQIENETLTPEEKGQLSDFLRQYLIDLGLNQILTIQLLNNLFTPEVNQIDIEDENIYITIFNIFVEELSDTDVIFSHKVKQIITSIVNRINEKINSESSNNTVLLPNSDNSNNNTIVNNLLSNNLQNTITNFDVDIDITNKNYLKEYIMRKNLKPYKCDICGLSSWQNNPLMLYLYSKNHIYSNKNLENLIFLCPNCYSQIGE